MQVVLQTMNHPAQQTDPAQQAELAHPVIIMIILILLVWRIEFGVTRLKLVGVMPTVQHCCPV
jgi:hypothetical protein